MIQSLVETLAQVRLEVTSRELADAIWLATQMRLAGTDPDSQYGVSDETIARPLGSPVAAAGDVPDAEDLEPRIIPPATTTARQVAAAVADRVSLFGGGRAHSGSRATSVRSPAPSPLPGAREMIHALRPLRRKIASRRRFVLDEEATVFRIAEGGPFVPTLRAETERWLNVVLVVDEGASMRVWRPMIQQFRRLLETQKLFRDVCVWGFDADDGTTHLYRELAQPGRVRTERNWREVLRTDGRNLIVLLSDALAPGWSNGAAIKMLREWTPTTPVAFVQMLSPTMWPTTAMGVAQLKLSAPVAAAPNDRLDVDGAPRAAGNVAIPVVTLHEWTIEPWARLVAGLPESPAIGVSLSAEGRPGNGVEDEQLSAAERVARFRSGASKNAYALAGCLAAAPLVMPIMRLVQQTMLPASRQIDLAEFYLGGLLYQRTPPDAIDDPEEVLYDFHDGVRPLLIDSMPSVVTRVLRTVSEYIEEHTGAVTDMAALLEVRRGGDVELPQLAREFARVALDALARIGLGVDFFRQVTPVTAAWPDGVDDAASVPAEDARSFTVAIHGGEALPVSASFAYLAAELGWRLASAGYRLVGGRVERVDSAFAQRMNELRRPGEGLLPDGSSSADAVIVMGEFQYRPGALRRLIDDDPILIIPTSSEGAARLFGDWYDAPAYVRRIDRGALTRLQKPVESRRQAATVADDAVAIVQILIDPAAREAYRELHLSLEYLLRDADIPSSSDDPLSDVFADCIEAAALDAPTVSARYDDLTPPAEMPMPRPDVTMRWVLYMLERIASAYSSARGARKVLNGVVAMIARTARRPAQRAAMLSGLSGWSPVYVADWIHRLGEIGEAEKVDVSEVIDVLFELFATHEHVETRAELYQLAAEYLAHATPPERRENGERIRRLLDRDARLAAQDVIGALLQSAQPERRLAGYLAFQRRPEARLAPLLPDNLSSELAWFEQHHEALPLWRLLRCLAIVAENDALRTWWTPDPEMMRRIDETLTRLAQFDFGRNCRRWLNVIEGAYALAAAPQHALVGRRIRWVENPEQSSEHEIEQLQALGAEITTSRSANEVIDALSRRAVDVIVYRAPRTPGVWVRREAKRVGAEIICYHARATDRDRPFERDVFGNATSVGQLVQLVAATTAGGPVPLAERVANRRRKAAFEEKRAITASGPLVPRAAPLRHKHGDVRAIAWSPDGSMLASASSDGIVRIWDPFRGSILRVLYASWRVVYDLAWSPDSKFIATACNDGAMRIWNVEAGTLRDTYPRSLLTRSQPLLAVAWSHQGQYVAAGARDGTVTLWDTDRATPIRVIAAHNGRVHALAFSPDGEWLASASADETVKLISIASVGTIALAGHAGAVTSVRWSPDGSILASGAWDATVRLWGARGQYIRSLYGHLGGVTKLDFSFDGTLLGSVGWDDTVRLWQLVEAREVATLDARLVHRYHGGIAFRPGDPKTLAFVTDEATSVDIWGETHLEFARATATISPLLANVAAERLAQSGSLRAILEGALAMIEGIARSGYAQVLLWHDDKLRVVARRSDPGKATYDFISTHGLIGRGYLTMDVVWVPDVADDASYIPSVASTRSELVLPIAHAGSRYGAIDLQFEEGVVPSPKEMRWLAQFAAELSPHIALASDQLAEIIDVAGRSAPE